jgi:hypothetical protein
MSKSRRLVEESGGHGKFILEILVLYIPHVRAGAGKKYDAVMK